MCSLLSLCSVISPNPGHQRNPDKASLKRDPCQQTMSEPMPNMSFTQCIQGGNQGDLQMYEMSLSKEQRGKKAVLNSEGDTTCQSYLEVGIVFVRFCQVLHALLYYVNRERLHCCCWGLSILHQVLQFFKANSHAHYEASVCNCTLVPNK